MLEKNFVVLGNLGTHQIFILTILTTLFMKEFILAAFLTSGLLLMNAIAIPTRLYFFKERPKPIKHSNWVEKISASSFPSMHIARSTFLYLTITALTTQFLVIFLYATILITIFYSRIQRKRHTIQDVLGGIFLAVIMFMLLYSIVVPGIFLPSR